MPSDYQARVLADGASAYWPLDDAVGSTTARDLAGTRTATIVGAVTLDQAGVSAGSRAMVFPSDGSGRLIPATLPSYGSAFTLEAWVNPSSLNPTLPRGLIARTIASDGDGFWYWQSTLGKPIRFFYYSTTYQTYDVPVSFTVGTWTHLVLVGGGGTVTLYVNSVAQTPAAFALGGPGYGDSAIGGVNGGGSESWGWQGALQDVAVYQRALTSMEVADHYALRTIVLVTGVGGAASVFAATAAGTALVGAMGGGVWAFAASAVGAIVTEIAARAATVVVGGDDRTIVIAARR